MSLGFVQAVVAQAVMAESSVTQRHWRSREGQDCCTHPERHAGVSAGGVTVCVVARWAKARIATRVEESILIEKLTNLRTRTKGNIGGDMGKCASFIFPESSCTDPFLWFHLQAKVPCGKHLLWDTIISARGGIQTIR
jgi:hypothetical protein